eukprot:173446_1
MAEECYNFYKQELMLNGVYRIREFNERRWEIARLRFENGLIYAPSNKQIQIGSYTSNGAFTWNSGKNWMGYGHIVTGKIHFEMGHLDTISRVFIKNVKFRDISSDHITEQVSYRILMSSGAEEGTLEHKKTRFNQILLELKELKESQPQLVDLVTKKESAYKTLGVKHEEMRNTHSTLYQKIDSLKDKQRQCEAVQKQEIEALEAIGKPYLNAILQNDRKLSRLRDENRKLIAERNATQQIQNTLKKQINQINDPNSDISLIQKIIIPSIQRNNQRGRGHYNRHNNSQRGGGNNQRGQRSGFRGRGHNQRGWRGHFNRHNNSQRGYRGSGRRGYRGRRGRRGYRGRGGRERGTDIPRAYRY